jgi:cytochrome c553
LKKVFKWLGFVVAGVAALVLMGVAYVYFASERAMHRQYVAADDRPLFVPSDVVSIADGQRIALLAGCPQCHGEKLNGGLVDDIPNLIRLVAPNISVRLPEYSNAQLATMLRKGVKPDGSSVASCALLYSG